MRANLAASTYWAIWIALFLVPELIFVFTYHQATLSDTVWTLERLDLRRPFDFGAWTPVHWTVAVTVWALFAWLSVHLPFGLLR